MVSWKCCDSIDLPRHIGPTIIPNFPLFTRLLGYAARSPQKIAIRDVLGVDVKEATRHQMLSDAVRLRNALLDSLQNDVRRQLLKGQEIFINLLAPGGYDFTVGFLGIALAGAVVVPISVHVPLQEALYFSTKTGAKGMVTTLSKFSLARHLAEVRTQDQVQCPEYFVLDTTSIIYQQLIPLTELIISGDHILNHNAAGVVIFTSGTSGFPKAAIKSRAYLDQSSQYVASHYEFNENDVVLHCLPVHHATGLGITFLPFISLGATIEFLHGPFDAAKIWRIWQRGSSNIFSGVPTMYMRLMRHFESMDKTCQQKYLVAARRMRCMMCGSAALPHTLQEKWMRVLGGKRILVRYGSTEMGMVFATRHGDVQVPDGSAGRKVLGIDAKLSRGDEGEILVKPFEVFERYLYDRNASDAAFDDAGYFKTGDLGRREGGFYFIIGRAGIDQIKSGGYKISALEIERECLALDYVDEVCAFGVDDEEYGERVAVCLTLRSDVRIRLSLEELRRDLSKRMSGYKLPTLLRVAKTLPRTASGKVAKIVLKNDKFLSSSHPDVQR